MKETLDLLKVTDEEERLVRDLLEKDHPQLPESLREARRQVELLIAMGLTEVMSRHEALTEAAEVVSQFMEMARQESEPWNGGAHPEDDGLTLILENPGGQGGISVRVDEIPTLIGILDEAASGE